MDPTKGVVDNFLRWISDQEQVKRSLSLDAALLSKAFNQDDLTVFTYIPEQEREALYLWLADQPFIRHDTQNGQCRYHELVQDMFSRYLFQRSPGAYRATRKAIADHYQVTLDQMKAESGEDIYVTDTWLELALGLIYQLFLLPDESSLVTAVKWVLEVYEQSEQLGNVIWVLSELAEEQRAPQMSSTAQQTIRDLLKYFSFDWKSQAFIGATGSLLEKFAQHPSFPPTLAARIYRSRGKAYREQGEYQRAIDDFTQAITRDAKYSWAYASRGTAHRLLNEYQEAIDDFTQAIALKPNYAWTYALRGETYFGAKQYKKAINDFDHAIGLEPQAVEVYCLRGIAHMNLKEYKRAIDDFDYALQLDPSSTWVSELRRTARKALDGGEKLKRYRGKFPSVEHLFPFWTGQNSSSAPDKKKRR